MAYKSVYHVPPVYLGPAPRIVCPYKHAFGSSNCINCSFRGVSIMAEINSYLEYLLKRERNNKKHEYLKGCLTQDDGLQPDYASNDDYARI